MPDDLICPNCGHPLAVHNAFNCTYAFERVNECHCGWGKELIRVTHERDEALKILNRPDVQQYLAWWNSTRND